MVSLNKGNSYMFNSIETIKQIIDNQKPHAFQEARIKQDHDLELIKQIWLHSPYYSTLEKLELVCTLVII